MSGKPGMASEGQGERRKPSALTSSINCHLLLVSAEGGTSNGYAKTGSLGGGSRLEKQSLMHGSSSYINSSKCSLGEGGWGKGRRTGRESPTCRGTFTAVCHPFSMPPKSCGKNTHVGEVAAFELSAFDAYLKWDQSSLCPQYK